MLAHRILGGSSSSVSCPCPPLGPEMTAMAHAHLWSLLRQFSVICGHMKQEAPLLMHPKTVVPCLLGSSRLFPGLPLSSCGALAPFRLSSRSQPQSSPWDPIKARASAPSPHPPRRVGRQTSQAGECGSAPILCAGISPLCPPHP